MTVGASVFCLVLQEPHLRHQAKTQGWLKVIITRDSGPPEDREADGARCTRNSTSQTSETREACVCRLPGCHWAGRGGCRLGAGQQGRGPRLCSGPLHAGSSGALLEASAIASGVVAQRCVLHSLRSQLPLCRDHKSLVLLQGTHAMCSQGTTQLNSSSTRRPM